MSECLFRMNVVTSDDCRSYRNYWSYTPIVNARWRNIIGLGCEQQFVIYQTCSNPRAENCCITLLTQTSHCVVSHRLLKPESHWHLLANRPLTSNATRCGTRKRHSRGVPPRTDVRIALEQMTEPPYHFLCKSLLTHKNYYFLLQLDIFPA